MLNNKNLSHTKFLEANNDPRKAAEAANLVYVRPGMAGFSRHKKGKKFVYYAGDKIVKNKKQLERIHKLAIPPSWKNVWICSSPRGHIQATGLDLKNRKQYRYHSGWNAMRNETKFHHLYEFGKRLPLLRKKIKKDLRSKELSQQKVVAAAIDLMEKTYIRVGNESYEKENGSYGLTTLKDRHVSVQQDSLTVCFTGKKGVEHTIGLRNKKLARIIKQCRDIPGRTLFQYYDENHNRKSIDSSLLNHYIKEAAGPEFSAKDIRTWAGSVQAVEYLFNKPQAGPVADSASVPAMLDWVSRKLGNSRNVCKKYYVHPLLLTLCEEKREPKEWKATETRHFSKSERILMHIIKN